MEKFIWYFYIFLEILLILLSIIFFAIIWQLKQDLPEVNSRAIFVDPNDGEILSQYAKLLWELHHDKDRATSYFKRAIHAASEDR
ncbi:hypothetical protein OSB04_020465 [Centaurea solstitialis]|uniref:Uncharacterized protein n=1 Tax=Centaurea solstitialis TaxID=347529 RepID=A0AA38W5W8_9ASTR|nr:hypothetical protein OSB04_020465 [Centaurea solstitialis]